MCFPGRLSHGRALGPVLLTEEESSGPQVPAQRPQGQPGDGNEWSKSVGALGVGGALGKDDGVCPF